jgi:hypothetical protein
MPEITADKIIGKTLFAKKKIDKLNYSLQKIGEFNVGDSVGKVYSYIQRGGSVYWLFDNGYGNRYAVKHDSTAFKISEGVQRAIEQQKQEQEAEKKQEKGAIPYYIEKYGIWVLVAIAAITFGKTYIQKKA